MKTIPESLLNQLRYHPEPAHRYFALNQLFELDPDTAESASTRTNLPSSEIIQSLLSSSPEVHPYTKWNGAHWRLVALADLGYPYIDPRVENLIAQVYEWLLGPVHRKSIRQIDGRTRRCASQEANAIYASIKLNQVNQSTEKLVNDLLQWQWPDGGWNCDKNPAAVNSSFWETWTPLRALICWQNYSGKSQNLTKAIESASEVFLKRQLFLSQKNQQLMHKEFIKLHHPVYWKYDILVGLELMSLAGRLSDPRCQPALDLLESKMQSSAGFNVEECFFQANNPKARYFSPVDWGGISKKNPNYWLTVRALAILKKAGRIQIESLEL